MKELIKSYKDKDEILSDYERFKNNWQYDVENEKGEHLSGLKIEKNINSIKYVNLQEWAGNMHEKEHLTSEEIENFRICLKNQFIIINTKNPDPEPVLDYETEKQRYIARNKRMVNAAKENGRDETYLKQMEQDLNHMMYEYLERVFGGKGR